MNRRLKNTKKLVYLARHLMKAMSLKPVFLLLKRGINKSRRAKGSGKGLLSPGQDFLFNGITVIEKGMERELACYLMWRRPY